ncbi:MAG: 2-dehydropantoate 2-reductase [Thermomicrobiales bacterium]
MNVFVLGGGAMGGLFGAKLHLAGHSVHLFDIWQEHVERIQRDGLVVEEVDGTREKVQLAAIYSEPSAIADADLVLVEVKSYDTFDALTSVREWLPQDAFVLSLQNGVGNLEEMRRALPDHDRIIVGTTAQGSNVVEAGHILRTGAGPTEIGDPRDEQETANLQEIAKMFSESAIPMSVAPDVMPAIWAKLAANAAINPTSALTGLRNGELPGAPGMPEIYTAIVNELVEVMDVLGIERIKDDYVGYAEFVMEVTATSYSSMLQDVRNRRRTEIDAINGAVARFGQEHGVDTPINRMIATLVSQRQRDYLEEGRGALG